MKSNITGHAATSIHAPVSQVWDALTKPEIIKQYFFGTNAKSDWKPGSPLTFTGEWKGKTYEDKGTVLEAEPCKLLQYTYWSSMSGIEDKPENYVIVTFELKEENDNTILTLTQQNIPDEKTKEHSEENWRTVLN
ncbi:MAG TPA: SRPBCC family protein, partial [Bacteroidia bacterium]|nr:SRPBCC family protein [Bacteroidia bacterium]